jgi:L-methionine (R)-S-oxide reductase
MDTLLSRLQHLAALPEHPASLEDSLRRCVKMTAELLDVHSSVILLFGEVEAGEACPKLKVIAIGADLAVSISNDPQSRHAMVLDRVVAVDAPELIGKLGETDFANLRHTQPDVFSNLIAAPIHINSRIVGILSASGHKSGRPLDQRDLEWLGMIGMLVGKSMQVVQLQNVLSSRFAQMALVREAKANLGVALEKAVENPDQLARILAKSFFREMTHTGFTTSQIIQASSEIIAQLSSSLNRHSKRLGKNSG